MVTHILPAVPPEYNGLGDYARQLYRYRTDPTRRIAIVALRVPSEAVRAWPGPEFQQFQPQSVSLRKALHETKATIVVLHYVGYGYSPDGLPRWLPRALEEWKRDSGGRLVTFFHELWATGPPWQKSFWTALPARSLALRIQQRSDDWATSCHRYMKLMRNFEKRTELGHQIPIGANIEPIQKPPLRDWPLQYEEPVRALLFGTPGTRLLALRDHWRLLRYWGSMGVLDSIHLVGRQPSTQVVLKIGRLLESIKVNNVVEHYDLEEKECSKAISEANVAMIHNRWEILHKSTAYACGAMHGLCCVVPHCQVPVDSPVWVASARGVFTSKSVKPTTDSRERERSDLGWDTIAQKWSKML